MGARRVTVALGLAVWLGWLSAPAVLAVSPSPSPNALPVCGRLPATNAVGYAARAGCDVSHVASQGAPAPSNPANQTGQATGNTAGQAGQAIVEAPETAFTSWLANGAAWVVQGVTGMVIGNSTTPSLDPTHAAMFNQVYGRVVGVALSLSVLLALIGIIEATLTQRPGGYRRVVTGIAVSGIGLGAVPVATAILVRIVDDLSSYVAAGPSQEVAVGLKTLITLLQQTDPATGAAAFALTSLGLLIGGALLWLELVVRESLIYLFLGVVPLACAAVQWPRLEGVLRQVLFGGLALILSKLVIAIALAVGFAVLSLASGLQSLLGGMFLLLIAALMPFATARVLPLAAEELSQSNQARFRTWAVSGVGTTSYVVTAISRAVGAATPGVPIAPAMGWPGGQGPGRGPAGPGPGPSGGDEGGRPGSGRPAPGRPSSSRRAETTARAGEGPASSARKSPASGAPPSQPSPPSPPPRGPRGPEPPHDAGRPSAK